MSYFCCKWPAAIYRAASGKNVAEGGLAESAFAVNELNLGERSNGVAANEFPASPIHQK